MPGGNVYFAPGYNSNPFEALNQLAETLRQREAARYARQLQELQLAQTMAPGQQVADTIQKLSANADALAAPRHKEAIGSSKPIQAPRMETISQTADTTVSAPVVRPPAATQKNTAAMERSQRRPSSMRRSFGADAEVLEALMGDATLGPNIQRYMSVLNDPAARLQERRQATLGLGELHSQLMHPEHGAIPSIDRQRARERSDAEYAAWVAQQPPDVRAPLEIALRMQQAGAPPQVIAEAMGTHQNAYETGQIRKMQLEILHVEGLQTQDQMATQKLVELGVIPASVAQSLPNQTWHGAAEFFLGDARDARQHARNSALQIRLQNMRDVTTMRAALVRGAGGGSGGSNSSSYLRNMLIQSALGLRGLDGRPLDAEAAAAHVKSVAAEFGLTPEDQSMLVTDVTQSASTISALEGALLGRNPTVEEYQQFMRVLPSQLQGRSAAEKDAVLRHFERLGEEFAGGMAPSDGGFVRSQRGITPSGTR